MKKGKNYSTQNKIISEQPNQNQNHAKKKKKYQKIGKKF